MIARLLLAGLCGALAACSSFDAQWREAKEFPLPQKTRWDGRWTSEKHLARDGKPEGGRLRCVLIRMQPNGASSIQPAPEKHQYVLANFRANWSWFASDYSVCLGSAKPLRSLQQGMPVEYRGTHDLPKLFGGTYRYTARISGGRFTARYDSSYDHGTFDLTRARP